MPQPRVERPTTPPPPPGHARIRPAGHPPQRAQSGLRQATRDKRALSDLIGVRSADAVGESARLTRDQPRLSFTIGHALAVILLLIVALGISLALLVQQSMNMAMLSQPTAMQTTGGSAGDQTMPSQNTTDEKRTDPMPQRTPNRIPRNLRTCRRTAAMPALPRMVLSTSTRLPLRNCNPSKVLGRLPLSGSLIIARRLAGIHQSISCWMSKASAPRRWRPCEGR